MYRVGIIGAQSHHSEQFSKLINSVGVIDAKVTHIWAEKGQEERVKYIKDNYGIENLCMSYEDMIGSVDVAFIVTRNGKDHFEQAKPFIDAGIPLWIDKPIALDSSDVKRLCEYAEAHGAKLMGGSTLKDSTDINNMKKKLSGFERLDYLSLSYCSSVDSPYGGISFYSIHMAEFIYFLLGDDGLETVSVSLNEKTLVVLLNYHGGRTVSLGMIEGGYQVTYAAAGGGKYATGIITCSDNYECALKHVIEVVEGKRAPLTPDEFTVPVKLMELIETAAENMGKPVAYVK